jgi:hypothetical protein
MAVTINGFDPDALNASYQAARNDRRERVSSAFAANQTQPTTTALAQRAGDDFINKAPAIFPRPVAPFDDNFPVERSMTFKPGEAIIRFDDLWGEEKLGTLTQGGKVHLVFDTNRFDWIKERDVRSMVAKVAFDGGKVQSFPIWNSGGKPTDALVDIPTDAKNARIWFEAVWLTHPPAGGLGEQIVEHESDLGKDYHFPVSPPVDGGTL